MYSLFCITEAEYIMRFRYMTLLNRYSADITKEVSSFIFPPRSLEQETVTTEIALFGSQEELVFFIKSWFDYKKGFFCCDDPNSTVTDNFANPSEFLWLPFEAFEVHHNGVTETMTVRDLYSWRH